MGIYFVNQRMNKKNIFFWGGGVGGRLGDAKDGCQIVMFHKLGG
jgi:hypothetical protein